MTALQEIIKTAQKMRKDHPRKYAKWTDYTREASRLYQLKQGKKSPGKKSPGKKKVGTATRPGLQVGKVSGTGTPDYSKNAGLRNEIFKIGSEITTLEMRLPKAQSNQERVLIKSQIRGLKIVKDAKLRLLKFVSK